MLDFENSDGRSVHLHVTKSTTVQQAKTSLGLSSKAVDGEGQDRFGGQCTLWEGLTQPSASQDKSRR